MLHKSQENRRRKAAPSEACRTWARRTPINWKTFSLSCRSMRSASSWAYNSTSATPSTRPLSSTTGKASSRCMMKNSQASSRVADAGRAITLCCMIWATGVSGGLTAGGAWE